MRCAARANPLSRDQRWWSQSSEASSAHLPALALDAVPVRVGVVSSDAPPPHQPTLQGQKRAMGWECHDASKHSSTRVYSGVTLPSALPPGSLPTLAVDWLAGSVRSSHTSMLLESWKTNSALVRLPLALSRHTPMSSFLSTMWRGRNCVYRYHQRCRWEKRVRDVAVCATWRFPRSTS